MFFLCWQFLQAIFWMMFSASLTIVILGDPGSKLGNNFSVLTLAAAYHNNEVLQLLLTHRAHVNAKCGSKKTVLGWACVSDNVPGVRLLLEAKAEGFNMGHVRGSYTGCAPNHLKRIFQSKPSSYWGSWILRNRHTWRYPNIVMFIWGAPELWETRSSMLVNMQLPVGEHRFKSLVLVRFIDHRYPFFRGKSVSLVHLHLFFPICFDHTLIIPGRLSHQMLPSPEPLSVCLHLWQFGSYEGTVGDHATWSRL